MKINVPIEIKFKLGDVAWVNITREQTSKCKSCKSNLSNVKKTTVEKVKIDKITVNSIITSAPGISSAITYHIKGNKFNLAAYETSLHKTKIEASKDTNPLYSYY